MALPVTFVAGDVLDAAQLNSNFTYVEGLGGLTYITQATPSAVTSISINNCFTSAYENYLITFNPSAFGASVGTVTLRLRVGGVDTSTNYISQDVISFSSSVTGRNNVVGTDEMQFGQMSATARNAFYVHNIAAPQLASQTSLVGNFGGNDGSNTVLLTMFNAQTSATSFDGFTLLGTATMTGTIRVYGYQNS